MTRAERTYLVPATILIALLCRILSYAWGLSADIPPSGDSFSFFGTIPSLWQSMGSFAIGLIGSFIAVRFSAFYLLLHEGGLKLFAFLMILLLNTHQAFFSIQPYSLSILLFVALLFCLFGTYGYSNIPRKTLNVGFCIGLSAVLWSPSLLLVPFMLIQLYPMKSLSFKNLLAFFFGLFLPLWCCLPLFLLLGEEQYIIDNLNLLSQWGFSYPTSHVSAWKWLYPSLLLALYLISFVYLQLTYTREKVIARIYFFSLLCAGCYMLLLSAVMPAASDGFLYLATFPISVHGARFLYSQSRRPANILISLILLAFPISLFVSSFFL
ncbi:DUF6427 family protein [Porphyromonas gulae]|uniref:DUF6427 family protein n=1 Tax=Porphyromonas gulae TaxID=111105 RepID=UPI00051CE660|nr:DUF6427 family protein [Porphyromonas gulae]KGL47079.1 hypothetical protein HQ49_10190 [Porphyromonas gulae]